MKFVAAVLLSLVLAACAGSGAIKWGDARRIKVGMTESEVSAIMGSPYQSQVIDSDGNYRWVWIHVNVLAGGGANKMTADFKNGVVVKVPVIPESFGK